MNPAFLDLVVAIVWSSEGARSITTTMTTNGTNVMMSYTMNMNRMNDRLMMNVMTTDSKKNGRRNETSKLAARRYDFVVGDQRSSAFDYCWKSLSAGLACAGLPKTLAS